jgi:hypothetical protein
MSRLLILTTLSLSLVACGAQSATPQSPTPPSAPPVADEEFPGAGPRPAENEVRLDAGGIPGGNAHTWGPRTIDVRKVDGGWVARLHDAVSFQGSGMQPSEMEPTRHGCTAWERVPDDVAAQAKLDTLPLGGKHAIKNAAADVLDAWYQKTAPPPPEPDPMRPTNLGIGDYFGRVQSGC